jgi:DNA polymerase III psi subunit
MDLNQVKLTPNLLCGLYEQVLVIEKNRPVETLNSNIDSNNTLAPIRSLGRHQKSILIVVNTPDSPFLKDEELNYLTRILNACKLTLEDVALVNIASLTAFTYKDLQQQYPSDKVICFGVTPEMLELPLDFPYYQLQRSGNCTYVHAPTLASLEPQEQERRKLWASLQKFFNIG